MKKVTDITGNRYGKLTVEKFSCRKNLKTYWLCRCDCGKLKEVEGHHLKCGDTQSCGCHHLEKITTHGLSKTKSYAIWYGIMSRCYNPNSNAYEYYGGRGLGVSKSWRNFLNFYRDVGEKPHGKSLDRIDNNKGYSKSNCRWASRKEQANNTRDNLSIFIVEQNKTYSVAEYASLKGVAYSTIYSRVVRKNCKYKLTNKRS
jgi:hypothetical protein